MKYANQLVQYNVFDGFANPDGDGRRVVCARSRRPFGRFYLLLINDPDDRAGNYGGIPSILWSSNVQMSFYPPNLFLLLGAAALQAPVLDWVSEHRDHHRFVDRNADPYNIIKGFFWAHMGWTFYRYSEPRRCDNIPDLVNNKLLLAQQRYHLPLGIIVGFGLPFLVGMAYGRPWGGLLWGGPLRLVIAHHLTFLVNSAGHYFGRQPYSDCNSSRDSVLLSLVTLGEGYHNFHHTFPGDYRNGVRWYDWDPTKWWIFSLSLVGLTWKLNRTPPERITGQRRAMRDRGNAIMQRE